MAITLLTNTQIDNLVGQRHVTVGFEYPVRGLQPYYQWLIGTLHQLAETSMGQLRVAQDDAGPTTVTIAPGRATINSTVVVFAGSTVDLTTYNNDTAYVWLYDNSGAAIAHDTDANGWPIVAHIKLAEVTLAAGAITDILDRRMESVFNV